MLCRGIYLARLNGEALLDEDTGRRILRSYDSLALICQTLSDLRLGHGTPTQNIPLDYCDDACGFFCSKSSHQTNADYLLMSAKISCGESGHNHMDMLSVAITFGSQEFIGEPHSRQFYYTIRMGSEERGYMYNMESHNTVLAYGKPVLPNAMYAKTAFHSRENGSYVCARHDAYTVCRHQREILFHRSRGVILRDTLFSGNRMPDAHMDPAGFDFTAYGRPLLADPGIYCYRDDENRRHFKSIHWHNCLSLNHEDPWKYISSWDYGDQKPGDILQVVENDRMMYAIAEHSNYSPAVHKRAVAFVDQRFLVVLDVLEQVTEDSSVQINFHIDSPAVMADSERSYARSLSEEANIGVYTDSQIKPSLIPAKRSTKNDVWHDTMIARFQAEHLAAGRHGFLSVAYPAPAGKEVPMVTDMKKEFRADGCFVGSFIVNGVHYRLELMRDRLSIAEIE